MNGDPKLYAILKELDIAFDYYEHPPVPTVKEAAIYWKDMDAAHCKNLFLKEKECDIPRFFLVVMDAFKRLQINGLAKQLGVKKLTFASSEELFLYLG